MKTRRDFPSDAAWYRHHRACFELALERGITPKDAEAEIERIAAREKHRAATERLARKVNAPVMPGGQGFERWEAPWMGRD